MLIGVFVEYCSIVVVFIAGTEGKTTEGITTATTDSGDAQTTKIGK